MKDEKKTKKQLIDELRKLRRRLARCEAPKSSAKGAEKALRYSPENFRALVESATDGILIATGKGVHVYANKGAAKITGYSIAELLNMSMKDLTHPREYKTVAERYRKRLAGKIVPRQYETVIARKDGQSVPIELTAAKTVWQGQTAGLAIMRDITERRKTEEALRESEEKYKAIFDRSLHCVYVHDLEGRFMDANKAALDLLGYKRRDVPGLDFTSLLDENQLLEAERELEEIKQHGSSKKSNTYKLKTRNGQYRWVRTEASVLYRQGKPYAIQRIARDITELKLAEQILQESEQLFRLAFEDGPLGMALVGLDYKLLKVNKLFCQMLGYSEKELTALTFVDVTHPEDVKKDTRLADQVFKGEIPSYNIEKRYIKKNGEILLADLTATVIRDQNGKALYGLAMIEDITESKQTEKKLQESEQRYRTTIDSMSDIVHVVDKNLRIILINQAFKSWAKLLKLEAKIMGRKLFEVFPFLPKKIREEYLYVFETGESLVTEDTTTIGDQEFITETRKIPILEGGEVIRVVTVIRDFTEQKRAQAALRESEEQYRTLVEESLQGLVITQGFPPRILFANSKAADIIGFSTEEILALTPREMRDLVHVEDRVAFQEFFQNQQARESLPAHFEFRIVRKDKIVRWVESYSTNMFYRGEPAVQTSIIDITERKQAEKELKDREEYFSHLLQNSTDLVMVVEADGTLRYVSPIAEKMYGYTAKDLVDTNLFDYVHPQDLPQIQSVFNETIKRPGPTESVECRIRCEDGSWITIESKGNNLLDNPVVEGVIVNSRDITERKQTEEELRKYRQHLEELVEERTAELYRANEKLQKEIEVRKRSEEALRKSEDSMRALLNAPTDSAWVLIDSKGIVLASNEAAARRLGKNVDEFINTYVFDHFPSHVAKSRKANFDAVFQSGKSVRFEDERAGRVLDTSIYPIFNAQGEVIQVAGFSRDITEQKALERQNQMKAELLDKLRSTRTVEDCLQLGCQTIRDAGLFERAILTLHNEKREITHLGQVGLDQKVVKRACKAPPPDEDLTKKMIQKKFQISHSFFIPQEAALDFRKTGRYLPQKSQQGKDKTSWKPGDELFVPIISKDSSIEGFLSVDTPMNGERPKANTILFLEDIVDIVARQIREIQNTTQLRQSEKKYRELADLLPQTVFELDLKGNLTFSNRAGFESFGFNQKDFDKGLSALQLFIPEDEKRIKLNIQKRLRGEDFKDHEYTALRKDTSTFPALIYSSPILHDKTPSGLRGIILDISERKRIENELREREELYRSLVETSPDAITLTDLKTKILWCNQQAAALHGFEKAEDMVGKLAFELISPEDQQRAIDNTARTLRTGSVQNVEYAMLSKNGRSFPGELSASLIVDTKGRPQRFMALTRDITERKRMELTQRVLHRIANAVYTTEDLDELFGAIHQELSTVVNTKNFFIALLDKESNLISFPYHKDERDPYVEALPASKTLTGYVIRNDQPLLITGKGIEELAQAGEIEILGAVPKIWLGVPVRAREEFIGALVVQNYTDESALVKEDLDILEFISGQVGLSIERKRAEEKLKQTMTELARSNAELEQFAYIASHDLQEPLQAVAMSLSIVSKRCKAKLDAEAAKFIGYAVNESNRMQMLIEDLLAYSRIGKGGKKFEPTDCLVVLDQTLDNLLVSIERSGAKITHTPLPTLMADPIQLTELFQNLIDNAIKFHGQRPPRIHISAKRKGDEWLFSVRDQGMGFEPEQVERIFTAFERLLDKTEYPGTGIGLAICRKIVERHGGRIWAKSQPGKGATFYFTIPAMNRTSK